MQEAGRRYRSSVRDGQGDYEQALANAHTQALAWLRSLDSRRIGPRTDVDGILSSIAGPMPDGGLPPADVVDLLGRVAEPGLMAMPSGRFFGWVIGGTLPAAMAADWLVSAWDQNTGLRYGTPTTAALEQVAGEWLLDLLGLPAGADVGFTTGATMANFVGLGSAREAVLRRTGWDVGRDGLTGAPRVSVLVGAERHDAVDAALRYLGLGAPIPVAVDDQGRILADALEQALGEVPAGQPVIVALQAGNIHSGAFDPFPEAIALAHERDAWVHVDGAFGLWAGATPRLKSLVDGVAAADSWATDAHKTLNVPNDCGVAVVARPEVVRSTFSIHGSYLPAAEATGPADPQETVPELSRRARGVPVWAALRSLGRSGVCELVEGLVDRAAQMADGLRRIAGVHVLNEVGYTQVCLALDTDERTRAVGERILEDGTAWISGSTWRGRAVLRVSVSNWSTDESDVDRTLEMIRRAVRETGRRSS
jgi:glutamate/tyrosine decarboxylase-like PLP-dependent enzyme